MATQSYFEQLADSQKKLMDSWTNYSEKVVSYLNEQGNPAKENQELFSDWYTAQRGILEQAMQPGKPEESISKATEGYQKLMQTQADYTQKWITLSQEQMQNIPQMEAQPSMATFFSQSQDAITDWVKQTNELINKQFAPLFALNGLGRMESAQEAYKLMMPYWENILKGIQTGSFDPTRMNEWFAPDAFSQMLSKMTALDMSGMIQQAADQVQGMFQDYNSWLSEQTSGYTQYFPKNMVWGSDDNPWFNLVSDMQQRVEKGFSSFTMLNPGRQSQLLELISEAQREYMNFATRGATFQMKLAEAGQKAFPQAIEQLSNQYQQDQKLPDYDTFFKTFINLTEQQLIETFESEAYASLQNDLAMAGVRIKNRLDRFMEMSFEGLPFTRRSETTELVKEVAELKRRLRTLERSMEAQAKPAAPKASTRRTTRTKKASTASKTSSAKAEK